MQLILIGVASFVIGAAVSYVAAEARREKEAEAKRVKWRSYAATKRERRKAARGG